MPELYDVADESGSHVTPTWARGKVRYITGAGKAISKAEFDQLMADRIPVALVQEGGNQPAMRGFAGGVADAQAANAAADAIGFPRNRPIYYVLEDPAPLAQWQWPTVVDYLHGVWSVGGRDVGGYGSTLLLDHVYGLGQIHWVWPVSTWPGGISAHANLVQNANPDESTLGGQVDEDDVMTPDWGQHPYQGGPEMLDAADPIVINIRAEISALRGQVAELYMSDTATDEAVDDTGKAIPVHWAVGYILAHVRAIEAKLVAEPAEPAEPAPGPAGSGLSDADKDDIAARVLAGLRAHPFAPSA